MKAGPAAALGAGVGLALAIGMAGGTESAGYKEPAAQAAPVDAAPAAAGAATCDGPGPLNESPAQYRPLFTAAGAKYSVDPQLLAAVAKQESQFNPRAVSPAGAQGLMQFMPGTARGLNVANPNDPAQAIDGAARLLRDHLKEFGTVEKALAAYNAGAGNVRKHGGVPPFAETRGYVRNITRNLAGAADCTATTTAPAASGPASGKAAAVMAGAQKWVGGRYVYGSNGPDSWDCSSFTQMLLRKHAGVNAPRTAQAQRDWCASGNCKRINPGSEKPGDMFFWSSYLGPNTIGHVGFVKDPSIKQTTDARSTQRGIINGSYAEGPKKNIFQIWRPNGYGDAS